MKFNKPTLLTITAPTCSGKNYLLETLEREFRFTRIVSTTTRQIRAGEVDGKDYQFISDAQSRMMEAEGLFAELITFRGIRYGVAHQEMHGKLNGSSIPMVILEPQGLAEYKKICTANNWGVYSVYIAATEDVRINRLNQRTIKEVLSGATDVNRIIRTHTDRLLSITSEERRWSNTTFWDAIIPGDDIRTALEYIKLGVQNRNRQDAGPVPYDHKALTRTAEISAAG